MNPVFLNLLSLSYFLFLLLGFAIADGELIQHKQPQTSRNNANTYATPQA